MKTKSLLLLLLAVLFSSCARNLQVLYLPNQGYTGEIQIKPIKPTAKTYITVNDQLVIDNKPVKSVLITDVPEGIHQVEYKSESSIYKEKVSNEFDLQVFQGQRSTEIIEIPPYSTGYWIYSGVVFVITFVVTLAILL